MRLLYLSLFLLPAAAIAADSGPMKPGPLPTVGAAGPAHHSRVFVAETTIHNGSAALDVPLDAAGNAAVVVFDSRPITARAPQGRNLPSTPFRNPVLESMDVPAVGARVNVAQLGRGAHNVQLETARRSGKLRYAVVQPESELDLVLRVKPLAARSGEPVTVTAQLDDSAPAQTRVRAKVRGVGRISLRDNGSNGDAEAGDGIYTARFDAPRVQGLKETAIRVDADGRLADGTRFRRTASAVAMVSNSKLRMTADDIEVSPEQLRVPLAGAKGRYRVEAVYGAQGQAIAWARDERSAKGKQRGNMAELPRPAIAAAADQAVIRVLDVDTLALVSEFAIELQPLSASTPAMDSTSAPRMPKRKAEVAQRHGERPVR